MADELIKKWEKLKQDYDTLEEKLQRAEVILQANEEQIEALVKELQSDLEEKDIEIERLVDKLGQAEGEIIKLKRDLNHPFIKFMLKFVLRH
ncbi:MAG: hypothetical protein AB1345_13455 [Chloroflexota bacterium]